MGWGGGLAPEGRAARGEAAAGVLCGTSREVRPRLKVAAGLGGPGAGGGGQRPRRGPPAAAAGAPRTDPAATP